jgi:DNA polymerase III delta prime subunit
MSARLATTLNRPRTLLAGLLRLAAALLGMFALLVGIAWIVHTAGGRPSAEIPLLGHILTGDITNDGYRLRWQPNAGESSEWTAPASLADPFITVAGLVVAYLVLWRGMLLPKPPAAGTGDQRKGIFGGTFTGTVIASNEGTVNINLPPAPAITEEERRNRDTMLNIVESTWVKGLLEDSLSKVTRIDLNLEDRPEAIDLPLNAIVQELKRSPQVLPRGTSITTVFDQMSGSLLILGAPGAGKTTLLLELARDLIQRARTDEHHRIPVVFNLSTWAIERKPLKEWMVERLESDYRVPRKLATRLVQSERLLPLLDGLDEVAGEYRSACVEAINAYRLRDAEGMVPLAVCSRILDYEVLDRKFQFQGAVKVQPLKRKQVEVYLNGLGKPLAGVRALLREDLLRWELLNTPLMLAVVILTYKDRPAAELRQTRGVQALWDAYIERMFARRGTDTRWLLERVMHVLKWLAWQMRQHQQTVYYIEGMQPTWLSTARHRNYLTSGYVVRALPFGLAFGLIAGLAFGPIAGLAFGLIAGLIVGLIRWRSGDVSRIEVIEKLHWSLSHENLHFGLVLALVTGMVTFLAGSLIFGPTGGWALGLAGGATAWLVFMLTAGLMTTKLAVKAVPNQGIRGSARSSLLGWLVFGLVAGPFGVLFGGLIGGLTLGLVAGIISAMDYGGRAVIQHYILRYLLARNGLLPFRDRDLVALLDYAADRILLRRVGGGWIFIHRLLLDHLADKYEAENPRT